MPSKRELASKYAARIRRAYQLHEASPLVKIAQKAEPLEDAIAGVAEAVDGLTWSETGQPISTAEKYEVFGLVATELGLPSRDWRLIKEGSVEKALSFEQTLMLMLQRVTYE